MTYLIHESNMERLEKKMASLQKKCAQSHCSFKYEVIGEEYITSTSESGEEYVAKYFKVEVEGTAKYDGWEFVATLDHHDEGNVVRAYNTELIIPEKYKTCGPTCEHCGKIRSRKDTYLIYNEDLGFKQVGRSCLREYTNGLSAEDIAFFVSIYSQFENSKEYSGASFNRYICVEDIVRYAFECYKHWGYQKSRNSFEDEIPANYRSTKDRVTDYYYVNRAFGKRKDELKNEMELVGFNPSSEYAVESTKDALEWIRNEEPNGEYIRNLKVVCSDEYTDYRSLGILVSLTTAYERHIGQLKAYEEKQKVAETAKVTSQFVGAEGERIEVETNNFAIISSWEGQFGMTYLYKFNDNEGNVFTWYASNSVKDEDRVVSVKGTIKSHNEYKGVKETILTRCKVTYGQVEPELRQRSSDEIREAIDSFLDCVHG